LWRARHWPTRWRQRVALVLGLGLLAALVYGDRLPVYRGVWYAARPLVPLTVLAGVALLSGRTRLGAPPVPRRQQLVLLLGVAALCGLVQFPFAAPIYFCYVGPLGLLAAIAVVATWDRAPHPIGGALLGFYFGFALLWLNTGFIYAMGLSYLPDRQTEPLALERGGVRVSAIDKAMYEEAVTAVGAHAQGDYIWAGPDCPEVYFLAAKRNPTRTLFDFFDEPAGRTVRVLDAIERHDVRVVVFNRRPPFSGAPPISVTPPMWAWKSTLATSPTRGGATGGSSWWRTSPPAPTSVRASIACSSTASCTTSTTRRPTAFFATWRRSSPRTGTCTRSSSSGRSAARWRGCSPGWTGARTRGRLGRGARCSRPISSPSCSSRTGW